MNDPRHEEIKVSARSASHGSDAEPHISVLLPTYNRHKALERTLRALEDQTVEPHEYEIVVVDDGSSDATEKVLRDFSRKTAVRLSYAILKKNGGPAKARNIGLARCRGAVILIIGDDIEPEQSLVRKHLDFHRDNPDETHALLGHSSFPEALAPTAFMRWLEGGGQKYFFNYQALTPDEPAGAMFFYTNNVSVKTALLSKSGWFDETFPYASHEDLELGCRLAAHGMQLFYDPTARGYHWHALSPQGIARRVYLMGYSAALFWVKTGYEGSYLKKLARAVVARLTATPPSVRLWQRLSTRTYEEGKDYPVYWHLLLTLSFFIGLSDARTNRGPRTCL